MTATHTHPPEADLVAYSLGQLGDAESESVEAHLAGCSACQARVATVPPDTLVGLFVTVAPQLDAPLCATVPAGELCTPSFIPPTLTWEPRAAPPAGAIDPPPVPAELASHPKYRVLKWLGDGGMGSVWLVEHLVMRNRVAVKVIRPELLAQPGARERFLREIRAVSRLEHPNIVRALDAEANGRLCLFAMEYVQGRTLAQVVRASGPLAPAEACAAVRDAARGLAHAHAQGMVHRDVKPHNLMRTNDGTVKVLDFGLALVASGTEAGVRRGETAMCGTPDYMAPEQFGAAGTADDRADVYGLGCTLYHLLAGRPPFAGGTLADKCAAHGWREPDPIPGLPNGLAAVLSRMMAKRPEDRFQSTDDVIDALAPFCPGAEPAEPAPAARAPRRGLAVALAAVLACAAVLATGAAVYRFQTDTGDLVIETTDDDIEVLVKQGGQVVTVFDPRTQQKVTLRSGEYEFEINGKPAGLKLSLDSATLKRGGNVVARITRTEPRVSTTGGEVAQKPDPPKTDVPKADVPKVPALTDELRRFEEHTDGVFWVAFSPDGRRTLSGTRSDGSLHLRDADTGKEVRRFRGHTAEQPIHSVAFSPDGKRALSTGDRTVRLWNLETGYELKRLYLGSPPSGAVFSPDGKQATVSSYDRTLRVFDLESGKELKCLKGHAAGVRGVAVSPNGRLAVTAGLDGTVRIWDLETGTETLCLKGHIGLVVSVAFSPTGRQVVSSGEDKTARLWDVETGKEVQRFLGHSDNVHSVAFCPDGGRVLTGSFDRTVRLWDADTGKEVRQFRGHTDRVFSVACSPDGRTAVSGSDDKTVRFWHLPPAPTGRLSEVRAFAAHKTGFVPQLAFVPNQKALVSVDGSGEVLVREYPSGKLKNRFTAQSGAHSFPDISLDGARLALGGDKSAAIYDLNTGKELHQFPEKTGRVRSAQFTRDGRYLLVCGLTAVRLWEIETRKEVWSFAGDQEWYHHAIFSHDEATCFLAGVTLNNTGPGRVRQLDAKSGLVRSTINPRAPVGCLALSPDGTRLAGVRKKGVEVWAVGTGKEILALEHPGDTMQCAAFSRDGNWMFTVGDFGGLNRAQGLGVWDARTGRFEASVYDGVNLYNLVEAPDGTVLTGAYSDGTVRAWQFTPRTPEAALAAANRAELGFSGHTNALLSAPDGKRVLVGGGDGTVAVWTPGDAKPVRAFAASHPAGVTRAAWSANGTRAATADTAGNVWLWDAVAGTRTRAFAGTSGCVGVGFLPNGRVWIVRQNGADVFDSNTGTSELKFAPPAGELFHCAAATPDGKRFLTGSHAVLRQWDAGTGKELAPLGRHPAWIGTVAISADGTRAAAGCNNSVVSVWNLATEQLLARRVACKWHTAAMCFSPDGTRLAFTGGVGDPALRVIDADTAAELTVVTRTANTLLPAFTPDGTKVLTGQPNGRVFIDPVPQLILQERLSRKQDGNLHGLSFLANGTQLLAHGQRATLWNAESGQVVRQYAATQTARAAVNRDGTAVAAWCNACALVHMFDTTTGKEFQQFGPVRRNASWPMQFARDGSLLLGENNRLRRAVPKSGQIEELWSADEGTQLRYCELSPDERFVLVPDTTTHPNGSREAALLVLDSATRKVAGRVPLPGVEENGVRMAKWSGHGTVIVGILGTGELLGFDWPSGRPLYRVKAHQNEGNLAAFADGRRVASVSNDGRLAIWDAATGDKLGEANTGAATWGVAVSPDGRTVATGSTGGELKLWNVVAPGAGRDVRMTGRWDGHTGIVSDVVLTGDGKRAVSVDGHGLVIVHDGAKVLKSFKTDAEAFTSLALSPDEKVIALGCTKNALKWYDLDTGKELGGVTNPTGRVRGVAFTADGKHLFAAGHTGAALWDRATGKAVRNFDCAGLACHWGALSPDGTRALVAGGRADGTTHGKQGEVRVFETSTGNRLQTLTGPDATISHATFSNDGSRVVAACFDGTARVWALDTGKQEHVFRHRTNCWVQRAALTIDGRQLVTTFGPPAARPGTDDLAVWDLRTGRAAYSNEPSNGGYSLALTPNGLTALVGDHAGGTVRAYALPAPSSTGPLLVSDFRTASGLSAEELKKWAGGLPTGFRPADVTARAGANPPRFDAVAIRDGSAAPFALSTELGTAERPYTADFSAMSEKGFSLRAVATYPVGDELLRHQLWVKDGRGWHGSGHLERDLPAAAADWRKRGLRPTGFHDTRAPMGGQPLVGVVLGPDDGWQWEFHHSLTQPELLALWLRARDRGWRIDAFSGFGTGANRRYAITLVNDPFAPAWDVKTDLTAAKFEEEVAAQRKRGLRPLAVTSHGDGAAVRYDAVWVEFSPAR